MIISHAHRFIFLKTQKCAGTSVELALSEICGPDDVITRVSAEDERLRRGHGPQNETIPRRYQRRRARLQTSLGLGSKGVTRYYNHMPAAAVRRSMDPALFDAYRKVAVVRNPLDREVSLYFWAYRGKADRPTFDAFVRRWCFLPERKTFDLYSLRGKPVVDTVLRYERLSEDFAAFVNSLGVARCPELPRAKSTQRTAEARNWRDFYTPDTFRIVAERYAREIEVFGYELS